MNTNYCVIDIETRGLDATAKAFVFGCLVSNRERKVFYSRKEMAAYLLNKNYDYVFAHNSEFDYTCLFGNLYKFDNSCIFVGSRFMAAKNNGVTFYNSLCLFPMSVEYLGNSFGMKKGNLNKKFKKGTGNINVTNEDIEYCYRDCDIIMHYLDLIFKETGKIKPTIASSAMHIFVTKFWKPKNYRYDSDIMQKFRNSYYGGRVECFKFGKFSNINKYDINSLYPYSCSGYFPNPFHLKQGNVKSFARIFNNESYEGCALVTVIHKKNYVGCLPLLKASELIYPVGSWSAWYNFNELRNAIKTGLVTIKDCKEFYYSPRFKFFELIKYMHHYFEKKNVSKGAEREIYKLLLNSLYGKFGQKNYGKQIYFKDYKDAYQYIKDNKTQNIEIQYFSEARKDCYLVVRGRENNVSWHLPLISSYICSAARITMLNYYLKYSKYLLYTDTDSLITSKPIHKKYIKNDLGFFKQEHYAGDSVFIRGNKNYSYTSKNKTVTVIRGVPKKNATLNKDGSYTYKKMIRTKEAIRRKLEAGKFVNVIKRDIKKYTKRILINNDSKPIVL